MHCELDEARSSWDQELQAGKSCCSCRRSRLPLCSFDNDKVPTSLAVFRQPKTPSRQACAEALSSHNQ